jgi:AraC-like DNA-binding protein
MNEIASSAGFASTNHMNWVFRKKFGISPSRYRKNILLAYLPFVGNDE